MRWPWKSSLSKDQFVVSWSANTLAYVRARADGNGTFTVQQMGVERLGSDSMADFVRRLQGLGLKGLVARVMLRPEQYQLLQIDTPPVSPEELRSAARYQIRDMVSVHIDDITLDVMKVGDGQHKGPDHMFVVAATNQVVRDVLALGDALHWTVPVIDIQETAQRNLQSVLAQGEGRLDRADAALLICGDQQAVLTISANEELFFTRRLDLPQGFMAMDWGGGHTDTPSDADAFTPVEEYVPDYALGGAAQTASGALAQGDDERVQRLLVEVQRSLDLWDRTWSTMPLSGLRVFAGERSAELAAWLGREMGQSVSAMDLATQFPGLHDLSAQDLLYGLPLLGVLLRTETRKL